MRGHPKESESKANQLKQIVTCATTDILPDQTKRISSQQFNQPKTKTTKPTVHKKQNGIITLAKQKYDHNFYGIFECEEKQKLSQMNSKS